MYSPFKILVFAVLTAAIILVVLGLFPGGNEDAAKKIENAVDFAESREGQLHRIEVSLPRDFSMRAERLDAAARSVRFQCNSTQSCVGEKISVNPRLVVVRESYLEELHFRCVKREIISDCAVYFGENPAQLETRIVSAPNELALGETGKLAFSTKNTGSLDAVELFYSVVVFQKKTGEGEEVLLAREHFSGALKDLSPGETHTLILDFKPGFEGEHLLDVFVEGKEAGFGQAKKEFSVFAGVPGTCAAMELGNTVLVDGMCRTEHNCGGCNSGSECAQRWREKGFSGIIVGDASRAFSTKEPENGACN